MLQVYHIGENKTITASSNGKLYPYEYKRSYVGNKKSEIFISSAVYTTYSFSLDELKKILDVEKAHVNNLEK